MPRADTVHNVINFAPTHCPALPPNAFLPCLRHFSPLSTTRLSLVRDFTIMDDDFDTSMSITRPLRPQHKKVTPDILYLASLILFCCYPPSHPYFSHYITTCKHTYPLSQFDSYINKILEQNNRQHTVAEHYSHCVQHL